MTWSEKVKQRDGMKCVLCGKTNRLQAHHIKPTFLYPECRSDLDNGITLCAACHQDQHCGSFSGDKLKQVNGIDPDPEGRMPAYQKEKTDKREERRKRMAGCHVAWHSNDDNGKIIIEAAKAVNKCPKRYVAEAISMRLKAEGYDHDPEIFIPSARAWEDEIYCKSK